MINHFPYAIVVDRLDARLRGGRPPLRRASNFWKADEVFDKALFKLPGMLAAFGLLLLSALLQAALVAGQVVFLANVLAGLWEGQVLQDHLAGLGAFLACFVGRRIVLLIQDEALERFSLRQAKALQSQLFLLIFGQRTSLAHDIGTASTASVATRDIDDVARYIRVIPPKMCGLIGMAIPLLVVLFVVDWVSGAIALIAFPVIIGFMVMLGKQAKARAERQYEENRHLSNHFIDTLRGMESIMALGAGKRAQAAVGDSSERLRVATMRTLSVAMLSGAVLDLVIVFGVAAIAMMLAFRLMDGSVGLATALTALMLAPEYFAPIRSFAGDFHASLDGRTALAHIADMIERPQVASSAPAHDMRSWSEDSSFESLDVSFEHDGEASALEDVTFSCKGFAKVGILGASGAGKSTLVDLIAGFKEPMGGSFAVDGQTVDLDAPAWRSQLHYLSQSPHLFNTTLEDNIRFYAPLASREDVERAVKAVGLERLVSELPQGLDTVVGEGARALSGGEAQRVALARMLLDQRPILLFDEPTAHLDLETELELKERMLPLLEGRLVFFATHRLHWVDDMDLVIVLEGGRIAETGTPADLLARPGALRRLIDAGRKAAVA